MMTLAPRFARFLAASKPIPELPPVTTTTLPFNLAVVSHVMNLYKFPLTPSNSGAAAKYAISRPASSLVCPTVLINNTESFLTIPERFSRISHSIHSLNSSLIEGIPSPQFCMQHCDCRLVSFLLAMMTLAPRFAKFLAAAKPIPELPPVTTTTLPFNLAFVSHVMIRTSHAEVDKRTKA
uniref:SFRICE_005391 n=1 Tax=Spodoptera frugiperda TaxID=7108 RepID=A0A2H1V7K1_SPOFR